MDLLLAHNAMEFMSWKEDGCKWTDSLMGGGGAGLRCVCEGREVHGRSTTCRRGHGVHVLEGAWMQLDGVCDGRGWS